VIRVLHSVETFLNISENWIYPQVTQVPRTRARVVCERVKNRESFAISDSSLIFDPPPWGYACGIPRLLNAATWRLGKPGALSRLRMRWGRPQLLHAHFGTRGWESLPLSRQFQVPMVTSFYGYDAWQLPVTEPAWRERYRALFDEGAAFLVEGPAMGRRLVALGCPEEKVIIHRIGVDVGSLRSDPKPFSGELKVAMVGRFIEKKGLVDGLTACALAASRGVRMSVTIVGDAYAADPAGQQIKETLRALATQPGLQGRVTFTGFLPLAETRATLKQHDVFLCPSKHASNGDAEGGSPVTLTEAMALGLLCIGTRHCDIPAVILDGQTGYLCDEGATGALADKIGSVDLQSREVGQIVEGGRRHVEADFNLHRQLESLATTYAALTARGPA